MKRQLNISERKGKMLLENMKNILAHRQKVTNDSCQVAHTQSNFKTHLVL